MKALIHWCINTLIYSQVVIALGAVAMAVSAHATFGLYPDLKLLLAIFLGTLFIYHLNGLPEYRSTKRILTIVLLVLLGVGVLGITWLLNIWLIVLFACLGLLSMAYAIQVLPGVEPLRQTGWLKILLVAGVWAGMSVGPILIDDWSNDRLSLLIQHFIFIFAITIPFEIKDMNKELSVKTVPVIFGEDKSLLLAKVLIGLSLVLQFSLGLNVVWFTSMVAIHALAYLLIHNTTQYKPNWYFYVLIDGLLLLYAIPMLILKYA